MKTFFENQLMNVPVASSSDPEWNTILHSVLGVDVPQAGMQPASVQRFHFFKTGWFRYAAVLLLLAGTATFLYRTYNRHDITKSQPFKQPYIGPGGNHATLTLADGSTIVLDSAANGSLAEQGSTKILKLNSGSLAYQSSNVLNGEVLYNTIRTPNGGQYQIVLPDGSQVWLNAASSIKFPTSFEKIRKVDVTGEAYMEVRQDKASPFLVNIADRSMVEVLGTSFNINGYPDEKKVRTTLIEGSVKMLIGTGSLILLPGQQAEVSNTIQLNKRVDIEQVMAWKNGRFNFTDVPLEEVMRQLSRWYDIEVAYPQGVPNIQFLGKISRDMPLTNLLEALKQSEVHFTLQGRRLNVLP